MAKKRFSIQERSQVLASTLSDNTLGQSGATTGYSFYTDPNTGNVLHGSSGSSGRISSPIPSPQKYAITPLDAVRVSAQTGKPVVIPKFPNTPAGIVARSNFVQELSRLKLDGVGNRPISTTDILSRKYATESKITQSIVDRATGMINLYKEDGEDLQAEADKLQSDASRVNVYSQESVNAYNARVSAFTNKINAYESRGAEVRSEAAKAQTSVANLNALGDQTTRVSRIQGGGTVAPLVTSFGSGTVGVPAPLDTRSPSPVFVPGSPPTPRQATDTILIPKSSTPFKSDFTGEPVRKIKTLGFKEVAQKGGLGSALLKESESIDITKERYPLLAGVGKLGLQVVGIPASYAQAGTQYALKNINVGKGFKQSLEKTNPLLYQTIDTGINLTGGAAPRLLWGDTGVGSPLEGIQDKDFIFKGARENYKSEFVTQIYSPEKALSESGKLIRTDPVGATVKFGLDALDFVPFVAPIGIRLLGKTKFGQKALIKLGKYTPTVKLPTPGIGKVKAVDVIGLEAGRGSKYLIDGIPSATKVLKPRSASIFSVFKEDILRIKVRSPVIETAPEGFGFVLSKFAADVKFPGGVKKSLVGKPIPSQLASAEDTLTSIGGTTQYVSSVAPGKNPFKFGLTGQKFDVVEQPGASMLRSFSGIAQEGKLPSPELGFFSATETIRDPVFYTFNKKKGFLEPFLLPSEKAGLKGLQASAKTKVVGSLSDFVPKKELDLIEAVVKNNKSIAIKGSAGEQLFSLKNLKPDDIDFISTSVKKNVDDFLRVGKEQGLDISVKPAKFDDTFNITIDGKPRIQVSGVDKLSETIDVGGIKVVAPKSSIVNKVSALNDPNVAFRHEKDLDRLQAIVNQKLSKKQILSKIDSKESIPQFYSFYAGKGNTVDLASENIKISFGKPSIVIGKVDIQKVPKSIIDLPVSKKELSELDRVFDLIRQKDAVIKAGGKADTFGQSVGDIDKLLKKYGSRESLAKYIRINRFESKLSGTVPGVGSLSGLRTEAEAIDLVGSKIGRKASNLRGKLGQITGGSDLKFKYDKYTDFGISFRKEASAAEKAATLKFNKQVEKSFLKEYSSKTVRSSDDLVKSFKNFSKVSDGSPRVVYMSASALSGGVSAPLTVAFSGIKAFGSSQRGVPKIRASMSSGVSSVSSFSSKSPKVSASMSSGFSKVSVPKSVSGIGVSGISSKSPKVSASLSGGSKSVSASGSKSGFVSSLSSGSSKISSLSNASSKASSISSFGSVASISSLSSVASVSSLSSVSGISGISNISTVSPPPSTISIISPPPSTTSITGTTSIPKVLSSLTKSSSRERKRISNKIGSRTYKTLSFRTSVPRVSQSLSSGSKTPSFSYKTGQPKFKQKRIDTSNNWNTKGLLRQKGGLKDLKGLKNRTTGFGFNTRNDFRISNKFKGFDVMKSKANLKRSSYSLMSKRANNYNYKNNYSVSFKQKGFPNYKYSSKLVDKEMFDIKVKLKA